MEKQHVEKMNGISNSLAQNQAKEMLSMQATIRGGFENSIKGLVDGTMTLQKAMQGIWQSILQGFGQFISKKVVMWVLGENTQTAATVAGNVVRTESDWWAATQSTLASAWSTIKNIAMKAWEAAASVYASVAAIPVIGPFLAPVMAVAATGAVMGFAAHVASAEGGYDIPAGTNPMTQLHEKEMVLPAKHADVIRGMADGNGGGGSGGGHTINYNDHSGTLSRDTIRQNAGVIAKALEDFSRRQG